MSKEVHMLHVVKQFQRHFPSRGAQIALVLLAVSALALAIGTALMLFR